jgi:hypothetical protein
MQLCGELDSLDLAQVVGVTLASETSDDVVVHGAIPHCLLWRIPPYARARRRAMAAETAFVTSVRHTPLTSPVRVHDAGRSLAG